MAKTQIAALFLLLTLSVYCCGNNQEKQAAFSSYSTGANTSCLQDCCASLPDRPPTTYYYYQNTGKFFGGNNIPQAKILTYGYSGQGEGYMNPEYQCKQDGPLPSSTYEVAFCKNVMHQSTNRPCSFYLKPLLPFQVCQRDDFFIHGCQCCTPNDSTQPPSPGCSAGCVIISYENRKKIRVGDKLIVQSYEPKSNQQTKFIRLIQE